MTELPDSDAEAALTGGRVTPGVVRVGATVRRPTGVHSPFVHRVLAALEERRVRSVPRFLGLDRSGREILTFREGWSVTATFPPCNFVFEAGEIEFVRTHAESIDRDALAGLANHPSG